MLYTLRFQVYLRYKLICQKPALFYLPKWLLSIFFQVFIVLGMYIFASSLKDGWRCDDKLCAQAIALKLFYEDIIFHCCCYDWWLYLGAKSAPLTLFSSVQLSSLKLFKLVWIGRKMSTLHSLHPSFLEWMPCTINNKVKNQVLLS